MLRAIQKIPDASSTIAVQLQRCVYIIRYLGSIEITIALAMWWLPGYLIMHCSSWHKQQWHEVYALLCTIWHSEFPRMELRIATIILVDCAGGLSHIIYPVSLKNVVLRPDVRKTSIRVWGVKSHITLKYTFASSALRYILGQFCFLVRTLSK